MSASRPESVTRGALPDGLRLYAIGDIHGRFDLLERLYTRIRRDLDRAPPQRSVEIFLGDYIDRGPQSRDVLDWLIETPPATGERLCLLGNHEDMLLGALGDPARLAQWLGNGGWETLDSYGTGFGQPAAMTKVSETHAALLAMLPARHQAFLAGLPRMVAFGTYIFVHAGLLPGRAPSEQDPHDLVWIREPFLASAADFGAIVVHGHTPVATPDVRPNRINIDTGAFFTGQLTCLVLEGAARRFLQAQAD